MLSDEDRKTLQTNGWVKIASGDEAFKLAVEANPNGAAQQFFPGEVEHVDFKPIQSTGKSGPEVPLHTDGQRWHHRPSNARVVFCLVPAAEGGEATLLDSWEVTRVLSENDRGLLASCFDEIREIPFPSGLVSTRTVAHEDNQVFFTHGVIPTDHVARELELHMHLMKPVAVRLGSGEALVIDNHRMLHGRAAFTSERLSLYRLLVWTRRPIAPAPSHLLTHAVKTPSASGAPLRIVGARDGGAHSAKARLACVLALLRGAEAAALAAHYKVSEETIDDWRAVALRAAEEALE